MIRSPKTIALLLFPALFFSSPGLFAQAAFSLSNTLCAASTLTVSAATGTLPATSYTWFSSPSGPSFSSPNYSLCDIYFSAAGVYTITLAITDGTVNSSASQTITVYPLPALTLSSSAAPICVGNGATLTVAGAASYTWDPTSGVYFLSDSVAYVSPYVSTVYSVTGAGSLGCKATVVYTLDVNSYPLLTFSASSMSVCPGFASTLTALGATNYTWASSSFSAPLSQQTLAVGPGTYSLTGANAGCKDSTSVVIEAAPALTLEVSASRNRICVDDGDSIVAVNLIASGASSYSWAPFQPGRMTYSLGPSTAVTPSSSTCYTLTGANLFCEATAFICVTVGSCVGLEEMTDQAEITVFPNPALDKLVIRSSAEGLVVIRITGLTGKVYLLETRRMTGTAEVLDIATLPAGVYFVYLGFSGKTAKAVRVLKQ